jgi:heterodisulfide reductase subunit C
MELTFGDVMHAIAMDDVAVLSSPSLWCCEPLIQSRLFCTADIDVKSVIGALRREAYRRGLAATLVGDHH